MKRILAILTAFMVTISLTSCGGPSPTDVTTTFLDGIKDLNPDTIATVYVSDDKDADDSAIDELEEMNTEDQEIIERIKKEPLNKLLDFDYKLSNEKIDGDKATVDVAITTYDMAEPYKNLMEKFFIVALGMDENASEKEMTDKLLTLAESEVSSLKEKTYKKTATIDLVKVDDQWKVDKIDENEDLINGLTGGLLDLLNATENLFK